MRFGAGIICGRGAQARGDASGTERFWASALGPRRGKLSTPRANPDTMAGDITGTSFARLPYQISGLLRTSLRLALARVSVPERPVSRHARRTCN